MSNATDASAKFVLAKLKTKIKNNKEVPKGIEVDYEDSDSEENEEKFIKRKITIGASDLKKMVTMTP